MKAVDQKIKIWFLLALILFARVGLVKGQAYPSAQVNQSFIPPSPNAQASQTYGDNPISLANGSSSFNIPICQVKCGSLTLPINLSYNYSGFSPLQDAGWVGLGWNLSAGGVISRIVEGQVDSSLPVGYNYDQYNLYDSTLGPENDVEKFLPQTYDMAPDIFDVEFTGGSGKFIWYQHKAYQLDYDKQLGVSWPSVNSSITVTTTDGTIYIFGATEVTTSNTYWFGSVQSAVTYNSAWNLSTVISADKKDTIQLNYGTYTWQQPLVSYQNAYTLSTSSGVSDMGYDTTHYYIQPSIQTQVLQSITCRNTRINFVNGPRTDVLGTYPALQEIDVIDSITGNMVGKNLFSYEYFGQTTTNPQGYERLKLKRFNSVDTQNSNDTLTYSFGYINEYGTNFPLKSTLALDYWGYYNGSTGNTSLLPPSSSPYYSTAPPANFAASNNMTPNNSYSSFGALDTIIYPTGGYSIYQYLQNYFTSSGVAVPGPGICLSSMTNYDNNTPGFTLQKNYAYFVDGGTTCSGVLVNAPGYSAPPYTYSIVDGSNTTYEYFNVYTASNNAGGIGGISPKFYYSEVTESITSGGETHKSNYYFTGFNTLFQDVRLAKKVDYSNQPNSTNFSPVQEVDNNYTVVTDTSFLNGVGYLVQYVQTHPGGSPPVPPIQKFYTFVHGYWATYWIYPASSTSIQYDVNGNAVTTTNNFNYNSVTRNLTMVQQSTSDGQILEQKYKYPEDYVTGLTGNMVASRVLTPVIEKQVWMKRDANDSALISGQVIQFDQTIFKPVAIYGIETTAPIQSLSNETQSGGQYSTLLSTSQYVLKTQMQYDASNYPSTVTQASDMNMSYIWDYRHSLAIAEVKNAAQPDIAYCSFEADGTGNWTFSGTPTDTVSFTGNYSYNIGQSGGAITKSGLTQATTYVISYWIRDATVPLSIPGSLSTVIGKTINGWTYMESKFSNQTVLSLSGTGFIDELRLYPATAQMTTYTYLPSIGKLTDCDVDNRVTYYQYDGFGRLRYIKDQDGNIVKTMQYHYSGNK